MRFWFSRLQSASVYWRNELRVGPLVAHLQTIFVTAVSSSNTSSKSPNIVSTKPQRIIVHQPSSPLPVMRAPRITTCRLLTRFVPVNTFISQNAVAIVSPPGKWCGSKRATLDWLADCTANSTQHSAMFIISFSSSFESSGRREILFLSLSLSLSRGSNPLSKHSTVLLVISHFNMETRLLWVLLILRPMSFSRPSPIVVRCWWIYFFNCL